MIDPTPPDRSVPAVAPEPLSDQRTARQPTPDPGPPLPADSVLRALSAVLRNIPRIHLRTPDQEARTPVNRAGAEPLPGPQQMPGRYQLLGEIARGGMGAIFKGRDLDLGRDVAVKVMLEAHRNDPELVERFVEEAQIGGQLTHPGIVPVYELGQAGDQRPYFTMKLVKGQTLAQLLQDRGSSRNADCRLQIADWPEQPNLKSAISNLHSSMILDPQLLGIFTQVCRTMAYAHARGVIHRDLKPSNIMVGAFGEVQVMDWGLAKVLPPGVTEDRPTTPEGSNIRTARSDGSGPPGSASGPSSPQTEAGTVLGTPAYMAPEQARGEIDTLDERCDVFSLGAILCEILTGQPPFTQAISEERLERAAAGDVAAAFARLDWCGADVELIELARHCLAPRKPERLRHAGEVAAALDRYEELVRERLRRAELETAAARVQVEEEHKRYEVEQARARAERQKRRATLAAAVAVLLLASGGAAAAVWYEQDRAAHAVADAEVERQRGQAEQEVRQALRQAGDRRRRLQEQLRQPGGAFALLNRPADWQRQLQAAHLELESAQTLARNVPGLQDGPLGADSARLERQLQSDEKDYQWALALEKVRLDKAIIREGKFQFTGAVKAYDKLFDGAGLAVGTDNEAALAERISQSAIRELWVAALDDWALAAYTSGRADLRDLARRLLGVAWRADPAPGREQLRDVHLWGDQQALERRIAALAKRAKSSPAEQISPPLWYLVGSLLPGPAGEKYLRQAQAVYPADFWLNLQLGNVLVKTNPGEATEFFRAAVALRPEISVAHNNLGYALNARHDPVGAAHHFQQAIDLDPDNALAHYNLAGILYARKELAEAARHYQTAIDLDPNLPQAHSNLGFILYTQKDAVRAIQQYNRALQLDPNLPEAHFNLGVALRVQGDVKGAIRHYRTALELAPALATAHNNLGALLLNQGDVAGALRHFAAAVEIDPGLADAHMKLGTTLQLQGNLPGALRHFTRAAELQPDDSQAHLALGLTLYTSQDLAGAVRHLTRAAELAPRDPLTHASLSAAQVARGDAAGARQSAQRALALLPPDHAMRIQIQSHLAQCQQLDEFAQRVADLLQGRAHPKDPNELLALAHVCRKLQQYRTAARLAARALADNPPLADNPALVVRYPAACCAALAAAGQGRDAAHLDAKAKGELRRQALTWLQADLKQFAQTLAAYAAALQGARPKAVSPLEKLTGPVPQAGPIDVLRVYDQLTHWQTDADLAGLRADSELTKLPPDEQAAFRRLWAEGKRLRHQACACFTEQRWAGQLTAQRKEQTHELTLQANQTYVFHLESTASEPLLRLENDQGAKLAETNNRQPEDKWKGPVVYTPQQRGTYRLVVSHPAFRPGDPGAYTLFVREFAGSK